ncbi:lipopolysaccharide biosynthesis protein [Plesiomonas shigelloides]|uniref:lipopolysaccharide biosynthesis protein n=1 Tax=Plesiomonas shigelloides TaxID=703 RepID=UPI00387EFB21
MIRYWKDIIHQASGNTLAQLVGLLGLPILARVYSPEAFAQQSIFIQLTVLLSAFITFRYEYLIPLLKNKCEANYLTRWIIIAGFKMTVVFTFIILFLYYAYAKVYSDYPNGFYYLVPLVSYLVSLSVLFQHEAQREVEFRLSAISEIIAKLSYVISGLMLYFLNNGLGLLLTTLFSSLSKILFITRCKMKLVFQGDVNKGLIQFFRSRASGLVIANTILTASSLIPIYVIKTMYGENTLGQFSLVMSTIFLPSGLIGSAIGSVFYQRMGMLWNQGNYSEMKTLWFETIKKLVIIAIPIYSFGYLTFPSLYPLLFGENWILAGDYARLITFSAFFSFIAGPMDRLSLVLGLSRYLPFINALRLFLLMMLSVCAVFFNNIDAHEYILFFSISMSFVYIFDIVFCGFHLSFKINKSYEKS